MKRAESVLFFVATVAALALPALPAVQAWQDAEAVARDTRQAPHVAEVRSPEQVAVR
jgi:hypothetical protein